MWMKATEGADGTVFYIDRDSIKKEGALIRVWELQDLKAKGPLEEKSRRVLVEYDSKNERRRVPSFSRFLNRTLPKLASTSLPKVPLPLNPAIPRP